MPLLSMDSTPTGNGTWLFIAFADPSVNPLGSPISGPKIHISMGSKRIPIALFMAPFGLHSKINPPNAEVSGVARKL